MCLEYSVVGVALVKILHMLYEHDILSEDVILYWHKHVTATDDVPERNKVRRQVSATCAKILNPEYLSKMYCLLRVCSHERNLVPY